MTSFSIARRKMVDSQVRPSDVTDLAVIEAMLDVPRESFVPQGQRELAYLDLELPVTPTRRLMQPMIIGRLLQAADIKRESSVLIVGCATGYTTALVAQLASKVTATESDLSLAEQARINLARSGLELVVVVIAEAAQGASGNGPYDVIFLDGATEIAPENLYRQLKPGGRLVGIFISATGSHATIVTRSADDFGHRTLFDATAPVLPGLVKTQEFVF
jgi:protein-L-isoaspartate(D-aspartate) O-methyltransferase